MIFNQRLQYFTDRLRKHLEDVPLQPIYDIVVTGREATEHYNNMKQVLECCKTVGFNLNPFKCVFFRNKIKYLGHIIDKD